MDYQKPRGMRDLLAKDLYYFDKVESVSRKIADFYDFSKIETPIVEESQLFEKGTGESTEVVKKQMYKMKTRSGASLTLRPEGTPSVVRAYLENGMESLPKPVKLWYFGPFFRHERPQAGRFRQFYQAGFESIGSDSWIVDVEIIQIFYRILEELGFKNLVVQVNSIGDSSHRPYYKKKLASYLRRYKDELCSDCKKRLKENPLRILDCKEESCRRIIRRGAPQIIDFLSRECHQHFKEVLETLEEFKIPYTLDPYLVRGLDYYTRTVFEIVEESKDGSQQGSLAGGGRYDDLMRIIGGRDKDLPACGGALGVDRVVKLMQMRSKKPLRPAGSKVYLAQVSKDAKRRALQLLEEFRRNKIKVRSNLERDSLTSQLKIADRLGVRYVLILGHNENLEGKIILRDMESGSQKKISLAKVVGEISRRTRASKR